VAYDVVYPKRVDKELDALPRGGGALLRADFERFAADPLAPDIDIVKLKAMESVFRVRCGSYRLTFRREDKTLTALRATDRKDAY